jgi:hypothetical protein
MRWPRRPAAPHPLPDDVRARLRLDRHERVLAAAALEDGGWLVTTSTALLLADVGPDAVHDVRQDVGQEAGQHVGLDAGPDLGPGAGPDARADASPEGRPVVRHLWHEVAEATWEPEERVLVVRWATPGEPAVRLQLAEPLGAVPEVVRERVMSTYVLSQRVPVRGRRGVTVAVRRHAVDGSLLVQTVPDAGIDLRRPETAERVAALARELAQQVGLHG